MELINKAEAVNKLLTAFTNHERRGEFMLVASKVKYEMAEILDSLPVIESRPKGEWVYAYPSIEDAWECSECKCLAFGAKSKLYKFCPDCGADMRGEE